MATKKAPAKSEAKPKTKKAAKPKAKPKTKAPKKVVAEAAPVAPKEPTVSDSARHGTVYASPPKPKGHMELRRETDCKWQAVEIYDNRGVDMVRFEDGGFVVTLESLGKVMWRKPYKSPFA